MVALAARGRVGEILSQVEEFKPEVVALADPEAAALVGQKAPWVKVLAGEDGLLELAGWDGADVVLNALAGTAGLGVTAAALKAGRTLALANKESLVVGGELVVDLARKAGGRILPVDSEHSALFQCLSGREREVRRVYITSSGGPFRGRRREELARVRPEEALAHPVWRMGPKITVDSATLANKGLEVVEACHLFGLEGEQVEVVVHPQGRVHGLVLLSDGSLLAQVSEPDMRLPVAYALSYPDRLEGVAQPISFSAPFSLEFEPPDTQTFRLLPLAYQALRAGGTAPAVYASADEVAVEAFLNGRIGFLGIEAVVERVLERHSPSRPSDLEEVKGVLEWARREAERVIAGMAEAIP